MFSTKHLTLLHTVASLLRLLPLQQRHQPPEIPRKAVHHEVTVFFLDVQVAHQAHLYTTHTAHVDVVLLQQSFAQVGNDDLAPLTR